MVLTKLKTDFFRNISNIPGWSTSRKIVVIESDDWGSVRMSSTEAFERLKRVGIDESNNHYNLYDSLESNDDLTGLFETLCRYKDKTGKHPVMTGVNIVANPDFEKIKTEGFTKYYFEPFTETLKRYPAHNKVADLWKEGIKKRLFVPTFHGREHLNVQRWMKALQVGHKTTHIAFEQCVTGVYSGINDEVVPDYQAAFDIDVPEDVDSQKEVLTAGLNLFEQLFGYKSAYFVPTNGPFNNSLESVLNQAGVKFINTAKIQHEPLGNGLYKMNVRFLGSTNALNQLYITRNCFFEPSSMEHADNTDWVGNCLKEMEIAFRWNKPAVISSHRVNYAGFLHIENRDNGLAKLNELINRMLKRWPDIEFMTSVELGNLILDTKR